MRCSLLLIGSLLLGVVCSQTAVDPAIRMLCNVQPQCRECILANPNCIWCADLSFNGTRCYVRGDGTVCPGQLQDPAGEIVSRTNVTLLGFNQVSPSRASVRVRPGQSQSFQVSVRPARDFPIDLYLLMDLSFSMRDDLANLKSLGGALAQSIVRLSSNFSIGFGSFVEKVTAPFTTLDRRFQLDPCRSTALDCDPTYSYRHVISLTSDSNTFDTLVQGQLISGNQDLPEGGFDGLLQSLLCKDLIGWRELSRKLLLYITDAGFHLAGDGKLAGIVLPHPNQCMLPSTFPEGAPFVQYQESLTYDYPSVGQIAQALRDQDIIPIFAAQQAVRNFYDALATELGEGSFVGILESDSRNVVELVESLYNTISQRVIFDQEPVPGVSIVATPTDCPGFILDGVCNGLEIERTATFNLAVSVTECTPQLANGVVDVPVRVVGFGTIIVQLEALCSCPCEDTVVANSSDCSNNGSLICGECECNPGNFGEMCQCDATRATTIACPVGANDVQCTGRGTCQCGICDCDSSFFGPACECDRNDCIDPVIGPNVICSNRGTCGCNGCTCNVEPVSQLQYNGDMGLCECTPNTQNCRDPDSRDIICNGRGTCGCDGTCDCDDPYLGDFCEDCSGSPICFESFCDENRACANCALDLIDMMVDQLTVDEFINSIGNNPNLPVNTTSMMNLDNTVTEVRLPNFCSSECPNGVVITSGAVTAEYVIDAALAVRCEEERRGCNYRYFVAFSEATRNFTEVHVEYTRTCPQPSTSTPPWIIAISIIIPLIILGLLLLLLLKLLLLLWDYIEVQKFENELKNTKYSKNENPLYRSAAKDYKNPIYGQ